MFSYFQRKTVENAKSLRGAVFGGGRGGGLYGRRPLAAFAGCVALLSILRLTSIRALPTPEHLSVYVGRGEYT